MRFLILAAILTSAGSAAAGPLSEASVPTLGERLAACLERTVKIIDRGEVGNIRSYTKYDKHFVSLAINSIYVNYDKKDEVIHIGYIRSANVEGKATSAERAKEVLQDILSTLIKPANATCSKLLGTPEKYDFEMTYINPAYKSRPVKRVITMNQKGQFILP